MANESVLQPFFVSHHRFRNTNLAAGQAVTSPTFEVGDPLGNYRLQTSGLTSAPIAVQGPLVRFWLSVASASSGSTLDFYGDDNPNMNLEVLWESVDVSAGGVFSCNQALTSALTGGKLDPQIVSPFRCYRVEWSNGGGASGAYDFAVGAGGW